MDTFIIKQHPFTMPIDIGGSSTWQIQMPMAEKDIDVFVASTEVQKIFISYSKDYINKIEKLNRTIDNILLQK